MQHTHTIVFCDFDGTISEDNTLVQVLYRYAKNTDPEMEKKLWKKEISLSEGVRYFMEHIPSDSYGDIVEFSRKIRPRPGFAEMLRFFQQQDMAFVILSGGFAFMAREALRPYKALITDIRAVEIDASGPNFKVISPYDDGVELVAKRSVIKEYSYDRMIFIGDGDTDFEVIKDADVIFACDDLAEHLKKNGISFFEFHKFSDIIEKMPKLDNTKGR